jgi:SpoU rRNA methylase family enzyme
MIIFLSLLVCVIGLLVYALSSNGKVAEMGRIAYAMGLLAFLLQVPAHLVSLLGR